MIGALSGIKVIEISQVLAAPFCGYQFALLGADVTKIELPDSPDVARGRGPSPGLNDRGIGLTYQVQAGNKKSLALDFRTQQGREVLLQMISQADVFLENYSTGVMDALGIGYQECRARNPQIVYCSMTGYGNTGPKAEKGAYDNTIQAASGAISQSQGVKSGVSFVDYGSGYAAAFAISAALLQRERTGEGSHISVSMLEVATSLMAPEVVAKQVQPQAPSIKEAGIALFDTADGQLVLGAFKPSQYRKLGRCLADEGYQLPELASIFDWPDIWARSQALKPALQEIFAQRGTSEWMRILECADIPVEAVVTLDDAVTSPQLAARGYFVQSPSDPSVKLPLAGYRLSQGGPNLNRAPSELGQDSREALEAYGISASEIETLFHDGVVK